MPRSQEHGGFAAGDRVRIARVMYQEHQRSLIGEEYTISSFDQNGNGEFARAAAGSVIQSGNGYYLVNLEHVNPPAPKTATEVEARLAMYEAMPVKTVAVHVIIEELQWVIGALHRAEAGS